MGSVRRQLIAFSLMASPAMAEVCEKQRPGWSPADGPATMVTELVQFLVWGGGGLILLGLVLGLYFRKTIILNAVMLVTLIMAVPYIWPLDPSTRQLAMTEGCIGAPTLVLAVLGLVWMACLAGTLLKRKEVK
ncbi:MAG: hypothetical protein MUD11_02785 [Rhodobacteraceae bacterium]|jgi:hypothetical protein|nr:hypothetical protein [Paracoccaceae bacterium]